MKGPSRPFFSLGSLSRGRTMRKTLWIVVLLVMVAGASTVCGQDDAQTRQQQIEVLRKYVALQQEIVKLIAEKKHEEVIAKCLEQTKLVPKAADPHYNIACSYALLGQTEEALKSLTTAVAKGFGNPAHMREDTDLESLHGNKRFEKLLTKVRENEKKVGGAPYDEADEIAGVKTVEDFPEGGLRYRLRMSPEATKAKPNRLIVWLHPAGGSMNGVVEKLAPRFIEKNFALVVFTQKNFRGWNNRDATRLVKRTLPALAKIEGLDADKPVLLGYSAGGQLAMQIYMREPGRFGGLVLDAAYPVIRTGTRQMRILGPPKDEARRQVPVFVVVGEKDGGARLWRAIGPAWQKLGVPLRVDFVPDKGHTWLFGSFQLAALDGWLSDVAVGKIPEFPKMEPLKRPDAEPLPEDDDELDPPAFK